MSDQQQPPPAYAPGYAPPPQQQAQPAYGQQAPSYNPTPGYPPQQAPVYQQQAPPQYAPAQGYSMPHGGAPPGVYQEECVYDEHHHHQSSGMMICAWIFCLLSWIPLIGWINGCVHLCPGCGVEHDSCEHAKSRRIAGWASVIVATIFFALNLIWFFVAGAQDQN
eukprot:TRINITY_DN7645_c0_g1_i1.p1 TRINITY_DN7645_c0_g1~~TRINITY_DN7645_c0_g1_i1.p1  ORF type:complete len:177 (+),score=22.54 TRINITY_DN7645_c0_g1_i1:38-532(+)